MKNSPKKISFTRQLNSALRHHVRAFMQSFSRIWHTPMASCVTLGLIATVMALPIALFVMGVNVADLSSRWDKGVRLTLFLKDDVSPEQVLGMTNQLFMRDNIARVQYISPEEALQEFQAATGMGDVLIALDTNPLPGVMVVEPAVYNPQALQQLKTDMLLMPEVMMAELDMAWVMRLQSVLGVIDQVVLTLAILLGLGLFLVVSNTTRSAIALREQEIAVMKLVGATDAFVRRPFLYTGFWYGLLGSLLAIGLVWVAASQLQQPLNTLLAQYHSTFKPHFLGFEAFISIVGISTVLSMLAARLAVGHYLRGQRPR